MKPEEKEKNLFDLDFKQKKNTDVVFNSNTNYLEGEIVRVVFTNEDETYSVIKIKDKKGHRHTVVGPLSGAFEGQGIKIKGKWEDHSEYGKQFRAEKFKFTLPVTPMGIERYLGSGLIPGIGQKRAKLIVSHFKEKTLDILDNYSARLLEVPGFGKKTLKTVRSAWLEHAEKREIILYFQSLGISLTYCQKIYKRFGSNSLNIVKNNPYKLADEVFGIGFIKADTIAKQIGIRHNDEKRLAAGVGYTLNQLSQKGHVCYPVKEFLNTASEILDVKSEEAERGLHLSCMNKSTVIDSLPVEISEYKDFVYDSRLFSEEKKLSEIIPKLLSVKAHKGRVLSKIKNSKNIVKLNSEQLQAVSNVAVSPVSIITGGPGVGKTTVIGEIVSRSKVAGLKLALTAPTGKAAKRMSEATGHPASTVHRLLKWDPNAGTFVHNKNNFLNFDLLIIDEVSMIDIRLAYNFFSAVAPNTTLVLVGDVDQLPSVGPGNFLKDLIKSKVCPVVRLTHIYRQSSRGHIIPNAHAVNAGKMIDLSQPENSKILRDFYWIEQDDPEKVSDIIIKLLTERIPKRFGFHPVRDVQVLTPMTKGICGTKALNERIQSVVHKKNKPQFDFGSRTFKAGDKIMQIVNNYEKNVFNGDTGFISLIDTKNKEFNVNYDLQTVSYSFNEADQLIHAYAVTIHKSQGSEFPAVIVPCLTSHFIMLQRNLLYTALTRAKKLLILIGSKKALGIAISNYRQAPRYTGFLTRLKNNSLKGVNF
ncbi:MAG: ATP-dependent RecD-like DNA helicase [Victivallales bacterium]|nr:ATP-dependent RecD-like DNA helicase [Victivallales bacterium]